MADFDLTQTGQEVQNILDGAAMQTDLTAEVDRAELAEQILQGNIDIEETRAKAAEKQNADDIDVIEGKIPAAASDENQLADKNFVNSSIATATATYRGAYNLVSDLSLTVDATYEQIAAALANEISTADNNDYCFVQIPTSSETPTQIASIERYKFNSSAWSYEYTLNNSGFTADQWAALNSGITSGLVTKLLALPTNDEIVLALAGKQDVLTFDNAPTENSNNPVKSGGVYDAIDVEATTRAAAIAAIFALIPEAASALNQLADKNFVNSSISTATAVFKGTYNVVVDLELYYNATHEQIAVMLASKIISADNNDYCFVQIPTSDITPLQIARTDRYKFNGTAWAYEYTLNNSGFTAAQWAAINSGITSLLKDKLIDLPTATELTTLLAAKQNELTFDTAPTTGSTNPVTSGGVKTAIDTEKLRAEATEEALDTNKADKATTLAGYGITDAYTKTEVNGLVSTPHQNYVTVATYASLPASGSTDTIYRVSSYDGANSQVDDTVYSEYAWDDTQYVFLCVKSQIEEVFDITVYNSNTKYADLAAALGTNGANIPQSLRRGGMSVKFVQSSDNKYVQYFCNSQTFTTNVKYWEKTNLEEELNELNIDVNGVEWVKNSEQTGIYESYTKQIVDIKQGRTFVFELVRCSVSVNIYIKYKNNAEATRSGSAVQGDKVEFVATDDVEYIYLFSNSTSENGVEYTVSVRGCVQRIGDLETEAEKIDRTVYSNEWEKDSASTTIAEYYTRQAVDIRQGETFTFSLERCGAQVNIFIKYKNETEGTRFGSAVQGDEITSTAENDIEAIWLYSSATSADGVKYTVTIKGNVQRINELEEEFKNLDRTVYNKEWTKDTDSIYVNEGFTKQEVDIKQGEDFSVSLVRNAVTEHIYVYAKYTDTTSSVVGTLTVGSSIQVTAQKDIDYIYLFSNSTSSTGTKYIICRLGLVNNTEILRSQIISPFAGKNVVVLGDSHAQRRGEWMPKLCEYTKMNYLSELNSQLNIGNDIPQEYEMYFHPLRVQLQSLIDNRGTTDVDVILVENVHYVKAGNAKDYAFHPSQLLSFSTYNMTDEEEEAYWQANFNSIVGSFPVSSQKADTLLKSNVNGFKRVITFTSSSVAAGLFTLSIDGHDFATDITQGMTLAQAIAEIYAWHFGDYCDWENISYDATSITIRYKGSSSNPSISFSVNAGTTNISASVSDSNIPITRNIYRYLESANDADFLVKDKWHKMRNYFYNGYRTLKGFFEDININFPNAKVVVFSVPAYSFSSFDEHLNMGNFMETQAYIESKEIGEQLIDVAKLYNAITINVEKECGISPFNWFDYYSPNNVHPKTIGYERWAETIARFLV